MVLSAFLTVCVLTTLPSDPRAEQAHSGVSPTPTEKALAQVTLHQSYIPPPALQSLLLDALQDPSPRIREAGLLALVSRAGAPRFSHAPEVSLQWKQEYAMLQTLRPQVATATSDADVRVRRAALLALGNLDYSGRPDSETPVSDATLEVLRVMFHSDSDGKIRQEVMKAVALRPNPETAIGDFLLSGLDDAVPGVRQYAIVAAARVRSTASMPRVADALRDSDDGVRMAATSALGRYGSAARPYLPELRAALSAERNNRIRAQMERCLLAIQK